MIWLGIATIAAMGILLMLIFYDGKERIPKKHAKRQIYEITDSDSPV